LSLSARNLQSAAFAILLVWLSVPSMPAYAVPPVSPPTGIARPPANRATNKPSRSRSARRAVRSRLKGQRVMHPTRVREIQEALIRAKYLDGKPDGVWAIRCQQAMSRYQADQGWQSKVVPDSRALIKLGLGPDRSSIINPESLRSSTSVAGIAEAQD
jgi:peptidoglycan hydrolase-like protein with peptidoglycan-binding domain